MQNVNKLKEQWAKLDEHNINSAIDALLQHEQGRKFLWWLLEIGRIGMQPFANNALQTAFGCGELNVGQRILDRIITVNPQGYVTMMKESADERSRRDSELGAATDNERRAEYGRAESFSEPGPETGDEAGGEA